MAFVPVDKAIEGQLRYQIDGQFCMNSFWFKCLAAPTEQNLFDVLALLNGWWNVVRTVLAQDLVAVEKRAYDRTAQVAQSRTDSVFVDNNGAVSGGAMSNNVALVLSLKTGFGNRSARGRIYVPGIPRLHVDGNTPSEILMQGLIDAAGDVLSGQSSFNLTWCVASRYHDHLPRVLGVMTPITGFAVDATVDSQRRRLPGRGA